MLNHFFKKTDAFYRDESFSGDREFVAKWKQPGRMCCAAASLLLGAVISRQIKKNASHGRVLSRGDTKEI